MSKLFEGFDWKSIFALHDGGYDTSFREWCKAAQTEPTIRDRQRVPSFAMTKKKNKPQTSKTMESK